MGRRREHLPRIYFTVSAKTIKREPPINRASPPHDYECLHLPRQKKKEGELFSNGRRRKNLEILSKNRFGNLSNNFHAPACTLELRATRGIVHGGGDPRLVFYQGTLWYRRRFKGDSTMFTECRGPRRIEEECIEACMPLVGLSCKPLSSNPRYFAAPPYSIFRSTSIPVTLPRAATSPPVTPPCTPFPPFLSLPLLRPIYNRFFAHPVSKRDFPRCVGRTARDSLGIPTLKGIYLEGSFRVELGNSFPRDGIKRNFRFDEEKRKRDKVDSYIYANDLCDTKLLATFLIPFVATLNEVYTSLESLCSYYALPLQSNLVNWNPSTFLSTFSSSPLP